MRKLSALILAFSLIMASLFCAFPVSAAAKSQGAGWVYTFDSQDKITDHVIGAGSDFVYNSEQNAMQINAKTDAAVNSTQWQLYTNNGRVSISAYPVIAMRIKLGNTDIAAGAKFRFSPDTKNSNSYYNGSYAATTEWQTVYFDFGDKDIGVSDFNSITTYMADWKGSTVNISDTFYVAWIGAFDSAEHAEEYYKYANGSDPWIYTFDSQSKITNHVSAANADVTYNSEQNAMQISAKADNVTNSTLWSLNTPIQNIDRTVYRYLAMRVKLSDSALCTSYPRIRPTVASNRTYEHALYRETTEWQTVYYDLSTMLFEDTDLYSKIEVIMADWKGTSVTTDAKFYVAWVGGFADLDDLNQYSAADSRFLGSRVIKFDDARKATAATVNGNRSYTAVVEGLQLNYYNTVDTVSYDADNNALLLTPLIITGDHYVLLNLTDELSGISAADYPVIAYKAKWSNEALEVLSAASKDAVASSIKATTYTGESQDNGNSNYGPEYGGTGVSGAKTDWQIAYADFSEGFKESTSAYQALSLDLIGYRTYGNQGIPENLPIYVAWVGFFTSVDQAYAYNVQSMIADIPYDVTANLSEKIEAAYSAYNSLTDDQKALVTNAAVIESLPDVVEVVSGIDAALNSAENGIAYENCADIEALEAAYRELDFEARLRVSNYSDLQHLNKLAGIVSEIANLPDTITWAQKSNITSIEEAYETLAPEDKSKILNYGDYLTAKAAYDLVKNADRFDVNFDNKVNLLDLIRLKKALTDVPVTVYTTVDVNADGEENAGDLIAMKRQLFERNGETADPDIAAKITLSTDNMTTLSVTTAKVADYDEKWQFNHGAYITYFADKFYAFWQRGYRYEDCCGQHIVYATSEDGENWSAPTDFIPVKKDGNGNEMLSSPFGTYVDTENNRLLVYVYEFGYDADALASSTQGDGVLRPDNCQSSSVKTDISYYYMYTSDGVNWSKGADLPLNGGGNRDPHVLPSGKLFWAGWVSAAYSDDKTGTNWNVSSLTQAQINAAVARGELGSLTESAVYESKDGVLHLVMRTDSGYLWSSASHDGGKTWGDVYKTGITDDGQKFDFLTLDDGRILYIGTPVCSGTKQRMPLTVAVSEDGYNFGTAYVVGNTEYEAQNPDSTKSGNYSYPSAFVRDGCLYIIYAKQKEIIEVTKVAFSDIA